MSEAVLSASAGAYPASLTIRAETLRRVSLWLMVFSGSFVMFEPSPYEVMALLAFAVWLVGGLRFPRELIVVTLLLFVYMTGSLITLVPVLSLEKTLMWTLVGWFLAFTGLFYAMALTQQTLPRLETIVSAYIATAVVCSLIGILAYFRLMPGADTFLRFDRLKSTFEDPNVVSAFLVLPAVVLLQRLYIDGVRGFLRHGIPFLIITMAIFLSFSRGGWGALAAACLMMTVMTFSCARSTRLRTRIILMCAVGTVVIALAVMLLLSTSSVGALFEQRFSLEQSYDTGRFGRFGRHILGFELALEKPIGIGMLQFYKLFGEDPHNTFLNAFMSYGWIGGIAWPVLAVVTLVAGYRTCFVAAPWRPLFICFLAAYQIHIVEAWIIDIDHWRHHWLLFGVVWGLAIASARWRIATAAANSH